MCLFVCVNPVFFCVRIILISMFLRAYSLLHMCSFSTCAAHGLHSSLTRAIVGESVLCVFTAASALRADLMMNPFDAVCVDEAGLIDELHSFVVIKNSVGKGVGKKKQLPSSILLVGDDKQLRPYHVDAVCFKLCQTEYVFRLFACDCSQFEPFPCVCDRVCDAENADRRTTKQLADVYVCSPMSRSWSTSSVDHAVQNV